MGITLVNAFFGVVILSGQGDQPTTACIEIMVAQGDGVTPGGGWSWPFVLAAGPCTTSAERAALLAAKDAGVAAAATSSGWEAWINAQPAVATGPTPTITGAVWWAQIPAEQREYVRNRIRWSQF